MCVANFTKIIREMCGRVVLSPDFEFNNNNTCGMLNIKPFLQVTEE